MFSAKGYQIMLPKNRMDMLISISRQISGQSMAATDLSAVRVLSLDAMNTIMRLKVNGKTDKINYICPITDNINYLFVQSLFDQ
jgi:hypothetical protein